MVFDATQKLQSLQTVDAKLFEEVVIGREGTGRHVEVLAAKSRISWVVSSMVRMG